ncbi:MAG: hypothetical protein QOJ01_1639 [Solirubrobacterales bacterium]|jgi:hypothetical protein|nr:hypothetical protein [Solirubrobacterales bacterium]
MESDQNARRGAAGGIISVILFLVGFGMVNSGAPSYDASGTAWAAHFADHATRIQIGLAVVSAGIFFFVWFLGSLRSTITAAEGGTGRLASIAYGAGLIGAGALLMAFTGVAVAAFRPDQLDPDLTRAFNDFGALAAGPAAAAFTAFSAATAIAGYRHGALPAPVAGFSALSAITQPLGLGVMFCTTGAFAADGVLGAIVPIITFAIAVLTASWTLMRGWTPTPAT